MGMLWRIGASAADDPRAIWKDGQFCVKTEDYSTENEDYSTENEDSSTENEDSSTESEGSSVEKRWCLWQSLREQMQYEAVVRQQQQQQVSTNR